MSENDDQPVPGVTSIPPIPNQTAQKFTFRRAETSNSIDLRRSSSSTNISAISNQLCPFFVCLRAQKHYVRDLNLNLNSQSRMILKFHLLFPESRLMICKLEIPMSQVLYMINCARFYIIFFCATGRSMF